MSYSVDELFNIFESVFDEHAYVSRFLKGDDPDVTSVEIPSEHNGKPVRSISQFSFAESRYLREVVIPDSVETIDRWAFDGCKELRTIRLPKHVKIDMQAFMDCPKLSAEAVMAGLVGSPEDLSAPFSTEEVIDEDVLYSAEDKLDWQGLMRPDVFELAVKYDSFRLIGTETLYRVIVHNGLFSHFEMLEKAGRSPDAEHTDRLIKFSSENGYTEMTAFLLNYKNRKFGFNKKDNYVI